MARSKKPVVEGTEPKEKRAKKPRRPAIELLEFAKAKVIRFKRLLATWELKVAKLELQAANAIPDDEVLEALDGKTEADIKEETLALSKRLAILKRGKQLLAVPELEPDSTPEPTPDSTPELEPDSTPEPTPDSTPEKLPAFLAS